jgi:hypothetical protein
MGFSAHKQPRSKVQRPWKINPVWRGIGCVLILLVPIMSWFGTTLFLQSNETVVLPWQLTRIVTLPFTHVAEIDRVIASINQYFHSTGFVFGQIFFTIILSIIGFGVMAFLYAVLYKLAGPSRYGPFDVPPDKV